MKTLIKRQQMMSRSVLRYFISFGLLGLILTQVDFNVLLHETTHSDIGLLALATFAIIGQITFLNLRWHNLLNAGRHKIPFNISVIINLAGYFSNILFITSVGGIIAKSGLAIKQGVSFVHAVFATFLDRFMTLAALVVFTAIGLPLLSGVIDQKIEHMLILSVIFVILAIVLSIALLRSGILKDYILSHRGRSRFVATLRNFTENPSLMAKTTFHSLVAQAFFILSVYILSMGMDYQGGAVEFLALIPVLALISSLPISFGGWGVREGAFIYGLGLIGFSMESAFLLSVQVGVVTLIAPFIVALPYILTSEESFWSFIRKSKTS